MINQYRMMKYEEVARNSHKGGINLCRHYGEDGR